MSSSDSSEKLLVVLSCTIPMRFGTSASYIYIGCSMTMDKSEKLLAMLMLVLAVTIGISSFMGGVSDPGCMIPG
ncbi:MAG: hypothetical protein Q6373_008400 [Candidatus Sigynarchaeota archaeon]